MTTQAKSLGEVIKRLQALQEGDPETTHREAENLLCDALLLFRERDKVVNSFLEARERCGWRY